MDLVQRGNHKFPGTQLAEKAVAIFFHALAPV